MSTALKAAVLTVSDTRTAETDTSGSFLEKALSAAGHEVVARQIVIDDVYQLREVLSRWIADPGREITNDQDGCMPRILKSTQLAKQDAVAKVNITSCWINAQLHP